MANDCYNCDDLETHERFGTICAQPRAGGIDAAVFVMCGETLTESDAENGTVVNTLIDGDGARLVEQVAIGIDGAEQVLAQVTVTPCDQPRVIRVNFTGSLRDLAFNRNNMVFYNRLIGGYRISGMIGRLCASDGWDDESVFLSGNISFAGNPLIPIDGTDVDRFELTFTFNGTMTLIDTPVGVFDQ
jgi:hypothetical protein